MSDSRIPDDQKSVTEIEAAIRAAGGYVWPSDDLRPRTLEAAREHCRDQRVRRKLGQLFLAAVFLVVSGAPILAQVDSIAKPRTAPSANEMQQRALEHAAHASVGSNWGMFEAFSELRRVQANRLSRK